MTSKMSARAERLTKALTDKYEIRCRQCGSTTVWLMDDRRLVYDGDGRWDRCGSLGLGCNTIECDSYVDLDLGY
jgi:hypothetical protein